MPAANKAFSSESMLIFLNYSLSKTSSSQLLLPALEGMGGWCSGHPVELTSFWLDFVCRKHPQESRRWVSRMREKVWGISYLCLYCSGKTIRNDYNIWRLSRHWMISLLGLQPSLFSYAFFLVFTRNNLSYHCYSLDPSTSFVSLVLPATL